MFEQERADRALERAEELSAQLDTAHRPDADRLISACREVFQPGAMLAGQEAEALRRTLREASELLARRGARAMPLGALGRAALAHLSGANRDAEILLGEFEQKLNMFGL